MKVFQKGQSSLTFKRRLAIALLFSCLLMALYTGLISYRLATKEFRQMSMQLTEDNVQVVKSVLADYLELVQDKTAEALNNTSLRALAQKAFPYDSESQEYAGSLSVAIRVAVAEANRVGLNFRGVEIHMKNGYSYSTMKRSVFEDYESCLNYYAEQDLDTTSLYIRPQWGMTQRAERSQPDLSCIRFLYSAYSAEKLGVAVFLLNEPDVSAVYTENIGSAFVINLDGRILSSSEPSEVGSMMNNDTLLSSIRSTSGGGSVSYKNEAGQVVLTAYQPILGQDAYLVVPFESYNAILKAELSGYVRSVLLMALAGVLICLALSSLLSSGLSRSVQSLTSFLKTVDGEQESPLRYQAQSRDEIALIGEKVNEMLDKLQKASETREADLKSNQMLELSLIRSQINPHLLYNTLNSVLWNLQNDDTGDAVELVTNLSEYFKLSLSRGHQMIPMSDELALIRHYLEIQRLARHKAVVLSLHIPQALYSHPVMKLMLQPIVENAILHGFAGYRDDGVISITALQADGKLRLEVRDNGIGILPDELAALNHGLRVYPPDPQMRSFGLYNIHRGIVQTFGPGYGLHITSEISEYTCVTVTIPDATASTQPHDPD